MKPGKRSFRLLVGLVFSVLAIVIIVKSVNIHEVWVNIGKISKGTVLCLLMIYLVSMSGRAWRWYIIISQRKRIEYWTVFRSLVYGYMLNQLLPVKMGELARAEYIARKENTSRSFMLGTIAVERVFDLLVVFLFFSASILFSNMLMNHVRSNSLQVALFCFVSITAVVVICNFKWLKTPAQMLPEKPRKFVYKVIDNLIDSFRGLKDHKIFLRSIALTLFVWALTFLSFYLIANDLGIKIPTNAYLFIVSAGTFGMIIPSTSANIGVYHAVAMGALMIFSVSREQSLSFAIIAHALDFFPAIIIGGALYGIGALAKASHGPSIR